MADIIQTRPGNCPTHGNVKAKRSVPRIRFPFIVFAVLRAFAGGRPYRCPECGVSV